MAVDFSRPGTERSIEWRSIERYSARWQVPKFVGKSFFDVAERHLVVAKTVRHLVIANFTEEKATTCAWFFGHHKLSHFAARDV
jgi:hypothetical protein